MYQALPDWGRLTNQRVAPPLPVGECQATVDQFAKEVLRVTCIWIEDFHCLVAHVDLGELSILVNANTLIVRDLEAKSFTCDLEVVRWAALEDDPVQNLLNFRVDARVRIVIEQEDYGVFLQARAKLGQPLGYVSEKPVGKLDGR